MFCLGKKLQFSVFQNYKAETLNKSKKLILRGGLGNQLFQFAFLHNLVESEKQNVDIYFPEANNGDRAFNLHSVVKNCRHLGEVNLRRSLAKDIRFKTLGFLQFRLPGIYRTVFANLDFNEQNAYAYKEISKTYSYYSGYFQNWKYVAKVIEVLEIEIAPTLSKEFKNLPLRLRNSEFGVIHFRRGDMTKYYDSMGLLHPDYFLQVTNNALSENGKVIEIIVLTDDKAAAQRALQGKFTNVFGPDDVSEWQALALMSRAKFVVTSNSTFSWWGGLLASRNGAKVYIPNPWFLNWAPHPREAFNYPGFVTQPSIFVESS